MRQASEEGEEFLAAWEGTRLKAYYDPAGYLTIGTGHLIEKDELFSGKLLIDGKPVKWGPGISKAQALLLLSQDLEAVELVLSLDRVTQALGQGQFDALCSFVFNCGTGAYRGSTLRKKLLAGRVKDAGAQFPRWVYAGGTVIPGLVRRREAERKLWEFGLYEKP